ncbi:hypothetical protein DBV15_07313 [Temnothorax longispinosus]|uniref:Uncharacterized protein n=1 Tax=Temnothorax longispinosus TaxID=300112 RepID=A0A4S2KSF4_9HYME|nr:hypothetical protein DBV15_07313 [Temnothorax longispinosus]
MKMLAKMSARYQMRSVTSVHDNLVQQERIAADDLPSDSEEDNEESQTDSESEEDIEDEPFEASTETEVREGSEMEILLDRQPTSEKDFLFFVQVQDVTVDEASILEKMDINGTPQRGRGQQIISAMTRHHVMRQLTGQSMDKLKHFVHLSPMQQKTINNPGSLTLL